MTSARAAPSLARRRVRTAAIVGGIAGLIAYSAWVRFRFLTASPFPMGIDGYFYPIQLRSLLERGVLFYPSSPLALYAMVPLAAITDPITGARLGAAIGGALIAWPVYGVGTRLGGCRVAGIAAAAVATVSAGSFYLSVEFVKNAIGLVVGLGVVWMALRAFEQPTKRRIALVAGLLIATFLTHKMGAAVAVLLLVPAGMVWLKQRGMLARITRRHLLIGGGALAIMATGLGLVFPERFITLTDLHLLTDLLSSRAEWTAPAMSIRPGARNAYLLTMEYEALIGGVTAVGAIAALWKPRVDVPAPVRALGLTVAGLGVVLAIPWLDVSNPDGLGFRMRLIAYLPWSLCLAIVVGSGLRALRMSSTGRAGVTAAIVLASVAWVVLRPHDRSAGVVRTDADMVAAISAAGTYVGTDYVITSERHVGFMAQYYSAADVHLRTEPFPRDRAWRIITGNFIGKNPGLREAIEAARAAPGIDPPIGVHPRHPMGVVLVREATWQWLLPTLPEPTRSRMQAWFAP